MIKIEAKYQGYKLTIEEPTQTVTFPGSLCLEDALVYGLALQKLLGLPKESVLVRIPDIDSRDGNSLVERKILNHVKRHGVMRL